MKSVAALLSSALAVSGSLLADTKKDAPTPAKDAPPKDPNLVLKTDFEDQQPGPAPATLFVVEGEWSIAEIDGGKALRLAEAPLVDGQVQLGDSLKEMGGTIAARVKAEKGRRSYPRFGLGLHGMTGYRLRLFPAKNRIELIRNEEIVQSTDCLWEPGKWWRLELTVAPAGEGWRVTGRAWADGAARPEKPVLEFAAPEPKFSGKASLNGTPFAALPLYFDDIEIRKIEKPQAAAPPPAK
jgi:hypothetical protein